MSKGSTEPFKFGWVSPALRKDYGSIQTAKIRLEGYRAFALGVGRERNWYSPVRPDSCDEYAWFEGWDLAASDAKRQGVTHMSERGDMEAALS